MKPKVVALIVTAAALLLGAVAVGAGGTFSTATFTPTERAQLRAVNDWYKRCVRDDVPDCFIAPPTTPTTPATVPPSTTTTARPPTTTTSRATTTTLPPAGAPMPTRQNTGPDASRIDGTMTAAQFLSSGACKNKLITDQVRDESGQMRGRTFSIDNCSLEQGLYYVDYGAYDPTKIPVLTIRDTGINGWLMFSPMRLTADHVFVQNGAYWVPCGDCGAEDHQANQTRRPMPVTVTNSMFFKSLPDPSSPYHSEALHVVSGGTGYSFTNVRFVQEGPMNGTQTGAVKFTGIDSTFRNVYFDWGSTPPAAYYATYFEGTNVVVDGCRIEQGVARPGYEFPDVWSAGNGYATPPLRNCRDWNTGAPAG